MRSTGPMRSILVVTVITVLNHMVFTGARFTLLLFAIQLGASPTMVGILGGLFAILPAIFLVSAGRWADRIGTRVPMLGTSVLIGASAALPWFVPTLPALCLSAAIIGLAYNMFWVCSQQVAGWLSTPQNRTAHYSVMTLGVGTSNLLGPVLSGFSVDHFGHATTMLISACLPIASLLAIALGVAPMSPGHAPPSGTVIPRRGIFSLLRLPELRRVFLVAMPLAAAWDFYTFLMPIYGTTLHLSASAMGIVIGTFTGGVLAIRVFLPLLTRRLAPWRLLLVSLAISVVSYLLLAAASSVPALVAASVLLGTGLGIQLPVSSALLFELAPKDRAGEAIGMRVMLANISSTVLPLAAGVLSGLLGVVPVFVLAAAGLLAVLSINRGLWFAARRRPDAS